MSRDIFAEALLYERANKAARRFISRWFSRPIPEALPQTAVVEFLRRRYSALPADQIERCATEALYGWASSRANRFRGAVR